MVYISLGSNVGNRLNHLYQAVILLKEQCLYNLEYSIVIETKALLCPNAPKEWDVPYLNMIVKGQTYLSPEALLKSLKSIEKNLGRPQDYQKWSPRIIDLDILLYNDTRVNTPTLTIPHPELKNRNFLHHLLALMQVKPWVNDPPNTDSFLKSYVLQPRLVGVVNITKDSFSDGGKFNHLEAVYNQVINLNYAGASIIELGAQSTNPASIIQTAQIEYNILDAVLAALTPLIVKKQIQISIDTFHPWIALALLKKYSISLINDVKGAFDSQSLQKIADSGSKFCCTHSITIPPNKHDVIDKNIDPIDYLLDWGTQVLEKLSLLGFSLNNIIIDPGIGFGKNLYQHIYILKHIRRLKKLRCPIMVGHSRKGYINAFYKEPVPAKRDIDTIGTSLALAQHIDFLRVHNVQDHMRALVAHTIGKKDKDYISRY